MKSITELQLTEQQCKDAISSWKNEKVNYENVEKLISNTTAFQIPKSLTPKSQNENAYLHIYMGIYGPDLIAIFVECIDGVENKQDAYYYSICDVLKEELTLVDVDIVTTTTTVTLSAEVQVTNKTKSIDLATKNEPVISIEDSTEEIQLWNERKLDWLYKECTGEFIGKQIFNAFIAPQLDFSLADTSKQSIIGLFGLRHSRLHQCLIPVLIFVKKETENNPPSKKISSFINLVVGTAEKLNADDWTRPCPPFCRSSNNLTIFD